MAWPGAYAQTVRIGVFTLFHPTRLTVRPGSGEPLFVKGSVTRRQEVRESAAFDLASSVVVSARAGGAVDLILGVPGRIERRYHGILRIGARRGRARELGAVLELDREIAVASVVAAELPESVPAEALKAQAVVARSFLAASPPRHAGFDFCDTTHCQFLRAWPDAGDAPRRAAEETLGLVVSYRGVPIAPRYSAACGGHTIGSDADEAGSHGYRYRPVACGYCLRHPAEPVRGHRLGMCQQGAAGMAAGGASFRQILEHYYPGTVVMRTSDRVQSHSEPGCLKVLWGGPSACGGLSGRLGAGGTPSWTASSTCRIPARPVRGAPVAANPKRDRFQTPRKGTPDISPGAFQNFSFRPA